MERGRYTTYSQRTLPKRQRRINLPGSFEDKNKYIRCWHCGFIVDVERDLSSPGSPGTYVTDMVVPAAVGDSTILGMDTLTMIGVLVTDDWNPDIYVRRIPHVGRGCPFCGTTNL